MYDEISNIWGLDIFNQNLKKCIVTIIDVDIIEMKTFRVVK